MDATVPLMVLVMKLMSFSWQVYDGTLPEHMLTDARNQKAVTTLPSVIEFLGFVFYYPAFLIGPTFSYVDYDDYIHRRGDFKDIPDPYIPTMECLASTFIPLLVVIKMAPYYNPWLLLDFDFISEKSFIQLLSYLIITGITSRCGFYVFWKLAESACIYTGFGFNGYDEAGYAKWNRLDNCDMISIEFAANPRAMLASWNKNTALWLKEDVYERLEDRDFPASTATSITFFVSAFWHGVHLGYYASFLCVSLLTIVARHIRRHIRPLFADPHSSLHGLKPIYDIAGTIATHVSLIYIMLPFLLRDVSSCFYIYRALYFSVHIVLGLLYAGFESRAIQYVLEYILAAVDDFGEARIFESLMTKGSTSKFPPPLLKKKKAY
ncbi:hypothetical protein BSLG_002009 [Batrachochytrium salamandrivorans]|nr:hypothetical protein BSLG_002009 [Batrachochytrium salamandrivorans]